MPSYARRKDANQNALDDAARRLGWDVIDTSQMAAYCPGWPDAAWGNGERWILVEYKTGSGDLTQDEALFHAKVKGPVEIVRTVDDVLVVTERWWPGRVRRRRES